MQKRRTTRKTTRKQYSPKDYFKPFYKGQWQGMYTVWSSPTMWNDQVVHKTLREVGGKPYTSKDVRQIIKGYCKVMRQYWKKSKTW